MNFWLSHYFRSNPYASDYFAGGAGGGYVGPIPGSIGMLGVGR